MFAKIPLKINRFLVNMGRARARASQIYCVIRPECSVAKRECNVARSDSGVSQFFPYSSCGRGFFFFYHFLRKFDFRFKNSKRGWG